MRMGLSQNTSRKGGTRLHSLIPRMTISTAKPFQHPDSGYNQMIGTQGTGISARMHRKVRGFFETNSTILQGFTLSSTTSLPSGI